MIKKISKKLSNTWKKLCLKKNTILLLMIVIVLSEIVFNINQIAGFVLYSSLIALCLLSLSHEENLEDYDKLMIILMIMPIIRIIEGFIILDLFWKVLIPYSILLFLSFYYSVRFKLDHGHKKEKFGLLFLAILIGIVLGIIGNLWFNFNKYPIILYLIPLIAYSEEILFRGMIQNLIYKGYGFTLSILITAFLYGIFSLGYGFAFALFMFFAGMIIGLVYNSTKNIYLAVVINLILHYFLFIFAKI